MCGIGRAEAARFERDSRCFERDSKCFERDTKRSRAVSVTVPQTVYFRPHGSRGASDLRITHAAEIVSPGTITEGPVPVAEPSH